jgi:hypothetical protein
LESTPERAIHERAQVGGQLRLIDHDLAAFSSVHDRDLILKAVWVRRGGRRLPERKLTQRPGRPARGGFGKLPGVEAATHRQAYQSSSANHFHLHGYLRAQWRPKLPIDTEPGKSILAGELAIPRMLPAYSVQEVLMLVSQSSLQCILPPYLLDRLARSEDQGTRSAALDTLSMDHLFRLARAESAARTGGFRARPTTFARIGGAPNRVIYDQGHSMDQTPGAAVRAEGQPAVGDTAVNQAYDGLGATYAYYWSTFQRDSIDGQGLPLLGLVHYGTSYDNAFWDNAGHMFFGDGDGQILTQTTAGLDVIGHELTHGVTQHEANLVYSGQSGALNESVSDVFGIQVKQYALKQSVGASDWLIGAEIVGPELKPALRSMKAPGTANPHDTQPADMDHYVDGGDVHINSGIPNRAFAVAAITLGGNSWDAAGPIWYGTLCDTELRPDASFQQFAALTLKHAQRTYGAQSAEAQAVAAGWEAVKVPLRALATVGPGAAAPTA